MAEITSPTTSSRKRPSLKTWICLRSERRVPFGNETGVVVVNEARGREIPIYDGLSAHTAYIIAFIWKQNEHSFSGV